MVLKKTGLEIEMMKHQIVTGWILAGSCVLAACAPTAISPPYATGPSELSGDTPALSAQVNVDFNTDRGSFLHPERNNNFSSAHNWTVQRPADVAFFNEQGLHGKIYRTWVRTERIYDPATNTYNFDEMNTYLTQASLISDEILIVMDTRVAVRDEGKGPDYIRPIIQHIMGELKSRFPKIRYVEAFNEPDHNLAKVVTPERLYDYYIPYYQAVNAINAEQRPAIPLELGGPAFMQYNRPWMRAFLDRFAADPSPDKRLDFISYHAYGRFPEGTGDASGPRAFHFYKFNPSEVASERSELEAELKARGLDSTIPSFITELGIYPGPSFDNKDDPRPDYLIGAAGIASILYWYMDSPHNVPFNWVMRHGAEERKDQLLSRPAAGAEPLLNTFTPYGNSMLMMAQMKDNRVAASSNALSNGQGIYSLATKDASGAAIMVWNYQHINRNSYRVTIAMSEVPKNLRGVPVCQRMYRIDDTVSNYWGNPETANLQLVSAKRIKPHTSHSFTVDLTPNAMQLITFEPESQCD